MKYFLAIVSVALGVGLFFVVREKAFFDGGLGQERILNSNRTFESRLVGSKHQIFLIDSAAEKETQITHSGNNVNIKSGEKYTAWEGQVEGVWQIFFFDGAETHRVTSGEYPSQDLELKDHYIAYSQKTFESTWKIYLYDIVGQETYPVSPDSSGRNPVIADGQISWDFGGPIEITSLSK